MPGCECCLATVALTPNCAVPVIAACPVCTLVWCVCWNVHREREERLKVTPAPEVELTPPPPVEIEVVTGYPVVQGVPVGIGD